MKKHLLSVVLVWIFCSVFLLSCSQETNAPSEPNSPSSQIPSSDDPPKPNPSYDDCVDLLSDENYRIVYNPAMDGADDAVISLIEAVESKTGKTMKKAYPSSTVKECEVVIGNVSTRLESTEKYSLHELYDNDDISVYAMQFVGKKLIVTASDEAAFSLAVARLERYVTSEGFFVPNDVNEMIFFDSDDFIRKGIIKEYSKAELDSFAYLSSIDIDGETIDGFKKGVKEYIFSSDFVKGYPNISATPWLDGAEVEIEQPSSKNGGVGTVKVKSLDSASLSTYRINIIMKDDYITSSEIVNKGGAKGTVTFVLDDGIINTAKIVEELLVKYPELTATFALVTNKVADFELSEDGTEYVRDEKGNFVIIQSDKQKETYSYWKGLLERFPQLEITSHSHTHAYAGEDDTKLYEATDINGKKYVFPKGAISAEIYGSQQILKLLFGQDSPGFILPGISGKESGFTTNSWMSYLKSGSYLGARGTTGSTNPAAMVLPTTYVKDDQQLWRSKAFMVRYFNVALNDSGAFYPDSISHEEAVKNGASHARAFIDSAVETGGWACFCFHAIIEAGSNGTHPVIREQADEIFGHAAELARNNDAWVATYGDAIRYYCEWAEATTEARAYREESIELSCKTETENRHYTMPLTVKVSVPESWTRATAKVCGDLIDLTVSSDDDGSKFVLCDILPNSESVTILGEI